jgi:FkbM family methyltransferase
MKKAIKAILRSLDIDIRRLSNVTIPFGVDWLHDIHFLCKGGPLGTVLDVGANIGTFTKRVAESFPDSDIFAFEPVPSTYEKLVENTRNLRRVTTTRAGMSNRIGEGRITTQPLSQQNRLIDADSFNKSEHDSNSIKLDLLTVDEFCNNHASGRIGLLKTDTEGHDVQVLQGAQTLLKSGTVGLILCECAFPGAGEDAIHTPFHDIQNYLVPLGYHVVSFYTGAVNELGWMWGDVLFRRVVGLEPGPVVPLQPYRQKLWNE